MSKKQQQKYKILDKDDNTIHFWTMEQILFEINRDTSEEWTDYDETDWEEGLNEWTEYEHIK